MGNEQPNYSASYNTWLQYRTKVKASNTTNLSNVPKSPSNNTLNTATVTMHSKTQATQIPPRPVLPVSSVNPDQLKKTVPSVIPTSKISSGPVPQQAQQSHIKRTSIVQNSPHMLMTQQAGQKIVSNPTIPGAQPTILLNNRGGSKEKKIRFPSKIDIIDSFKAQVKATRNRIDMIANGQENEYKWILSEIHNQKIHLMPDKNKMVYLIKQARDYQNLIVGLRTKRQGVVRILNELNEQRFNEEMKGSIAETNKYVDSVEKQFLRIDWKIIILEAPNNIQRYIDVIDAGIADPVVQQSIAMIERQVDSMRPPPPPPQVQTPIVEPEPTNNLPQSQLKGIKNTQQKIHSSIRGAPEQTLVDQIEKMVVRQENQNVVNSQLKNSVLNGSVNSELRGSLNLNSFGLVVTTPSMIRTTPVHEPSKVQNTEQDTPVQQAVVKNTVQLSEIKNIKTSDIKPVADIKPVKPVINGFQSSVKPPPSYNAFSMPQSLLK